MTRPQICNKLLKIEHNAYGSTYEKRCGNNKPCQIHKDDDMPDEKLQKRLRNIEQILHDKYVVPNTLVVEIEAIVDKHARAEGQNQERMKTDMLARALERYVHVTEKGKLIDDLSIYDEGKKALAEYKKGIKYG